MSSKILSAAERKSIHGAFSSTMKLLEIYIEKINFYFDDQIEGQMKEILQELDKV